MIMHDICFVFKRKCDLWPFNKFDQLTCQVQEYIPTAISATSTKTKYLVVIMIYYLVSLGSNHNGDFQITQKTSMFSFIMMQCFLSSGLQGPLYIIYSVKFTLYNTIYRRNRNFLKSRQTEGFVQKPQNPAVKPFQPPEHQLPSNTMGNTVPQASQVQAAVQDTPPSNAAKTNSLIPKTPARSSPAVRRVSNRTTKGCAPERLSYGKVKECTRCA